MSTLEWRLKRVGRHTQHSSSGFRQRLEAAGGRWGTGRVWRLLRVGRHTQHSCSGIRQRLEAARGAH